MDWKKLAEEAQQLEETKAKQVEAAKEPPPPKMIAGDVLYHPTLGKCHYAGDRGDGVFFMRNADGRTVQVAHKLVRITAVPGKPRQYNVTIKKP